jgi:hypothetical protein
VLLLLPPFLAPAARVHAATRAVKGKSHTEATKPAKASPSRSRSGKGAKAAASGAAHHKDKTTAGRKGKLAAAAAAQGADFLFQKPANVVPNQQGKVVLFAFRNDDEAAVSTQIGHLLEARGLEVVTDVRPVDTAEQYRDVAGQLELAAYVDGSVKGSEAKTTATVRLRNGFTGRIVAHAAFTESRDNLPRELSDKLWTKLGPAMARACTDAGKPRKASRTMLHINAGTPIETIPKAQ